MSLDREDLSIILLLADRVSVAGKKDRLRLALLEHKVEEMLVALDKAAQDKPEAPSGPHKEE